MPEGGGGQAATVELSEFVNTIIKGEREGSTKLAVKEKEARKENEATGVGEREGEREGK